MFSIELLSWWFLPQDGPEIAAYLDNVEVIISGFVFVCAWIGIVLRGVSRILEGGSVIHAYCTILYAVDFFL